MPTPERRIDYGWRPDDYIVHGRHCDTAAVAAALEELRSRSGATAAILLVFRERTLFQSLLLLAHKDAAVRRRLQRDLSKQPAIGLSSDETLLTDLGHDKTALRAIRALRGRPPLLGVAALFDGRLRLASRRATDAPSRSAGLCIALIDADRGPETDHEAEVIDALYVMVNATSSVVLHRDIGPEQDLDRVIGDVEEELGPEVDRETVLLETARRLTRSTLGNFYLATRTRGILELAAERHNAKPRSRVEAKRSTSIVAYVFVRRRALLVNDLQDFRTMHPNIGFLSVTEEEEAGTFAELAVPIVQSSASGEESIVLGVINVEKTDRDREGYYTDTDLQLLRVIAERYCAWRLQELLVQSVGSLEQLTRRSVMPTTVESLRTAARDRRPSVPADLVGAKDVVEQIVGTLHQLTRSESVTVRLITDEQKRLQRFCGFPAVRMTDTHGRLALRNENSVNALVARTGKERYIEDFQGAFRGPDDPQRLGSAQARPGIRSELCLPIILEDRVVGTMNLESQLPDAYAETREIVRAVAQQVALALARSRRASEHVVFSMTSASTANAHELKKVARALRDHSSENPQFEEFARRIERCVRMEPAEIDQEDVWLRDILERVVQYHRWGSVVKIHPEAGEPLLVRNAHALPVEYALETLLHNAIEHMEARDDYRVHVNADRHCFGGRRYVRLRISNPIRKPIEYAVAALLYRQPLPKGNGLHIGAFTAAAGMRALGGEVYATSIQPPMFEVAVDIPVLTNS